MTLQRKQEISILSFWHKLEFFVPFDAKQKITEAQDDNRYCSFSINQLEELPQKQSVRHLLPTALPNKEFAGADIYLNLFDTGKISQIIQDILQEELSEYEQFSQEVMNADDGITCFAKLQILQNGALDIKNIQLSTVPWALGLSAKHGLGALNINTFEQDCLTLKDQLIQINQEYCVDPSSEANKSVGQYILSPAVLLRLVETLCQWAYHCPLIESNASIIGICLKWRDKYNKKELKNKQHEAKLNAEKDDGNKKIDDSDQEWAADDIGILNSFYAKDIHSIMRKINQGKHNPALSAYLKMAADEEKFDLYCNQSDWLIWQKLQPKYWNRGRWLSEPAHGLSLMQQFAVNTFFEEESQPVFSVNGPPGTGKTTLLRDIFAENIVRRAEVLAAMDKAQDAFIAMDKEKAISILKTELTGFEMVVVSSNNTAVENISRDLPKQSSLARDYQKNGQNAFGYLETVARNLIAKQGGKYKKLPKDQEVWGLFSCALGKKSQSE